MPTNQALRNYSLTEYVHLYRNKYVAVSPVGVKKSNLLDGFVQIYQLTGTDMVPMICEMEAKRQGVVGDNR